MLELSIIFFFLFSIFQRHHQTSQNKTQEREKEEDKEIERNNRMASNSNSDGESNITLEPNSAASGPLFIFLVPIICFFVGHLIHKYHLYWLPESVGTMFGTFF